MKVVLVHGGGPEISETMKRLGKQAQFVNGLRVTDKETVDIVQMVLAGKVNKTLVNLLQMKGGHAVGLSGIDGGIIEATMKDKALGYVGRITRIRTQPITDLLEKEIEILVELNSGESSSTAWGCDLTYDYVKINGDYRT